MKIDSIDICAYEVNFSKIDPDGPLDYAALQLETISYIDTEDKQRYEHLFKSVLHKQYGMGIGDELFVVGAFISRIGEKKNIPIIQFRQCSGNAGGAR